MRSFAKKLLVTGLAITLLAPIGWTGLHQAEAQFGSILGSLFGGGGGGQTVRVVSDISETSVTSTLKTILMEVTTAIMSGNISSLNIKETILDPIAWNLAKQMQQQMTGEHLKWLGGQQPGQNGQVPFVQDFGVHYRSIMDQVYGEFINELSSTNNAGLCSEEERHQVQQAVISYYREKRDGEAGGQLFSCRENADGSTAQTEQGTILERIFRDTINCDGDAICASLKAQQTLALRQASAVVNEKQVLDYSRGMLPQRVCRVMNDPDGRPRQLCEIVNPLFLAADSTSFQLTQVPSLQLLQMDEFNEIVSGFMTNLTNQALQGLTGVLGLTGNPTYSNNIFGADGSLSYVDALLRDDVAQYQSSGPSLIKQALSIEQRYLQLQFQILTSVTELENKNNQNANTYTGCYDLSLTPELTQAKANAQAAVNMASTSVAILLTLDQQFDNAADAGAKNAAVATYMSYKNQGFFHEEYENRQLEQTYNYTFSVMIDQFRYEMALAQQACGGPFDYNGVLGSGGS